MLLNNLSIVSAKSKIEFQYDSVALAENRNFVATGVSAIRKEVNSGKTVASKSTMKKLAKSNNPANTFRAYYQVNMKSGATYYKVVTMNGKYRGYIKSNGIRQIQTLTNVNLYDQVKGKLVTLDNVNIHPIFEFPNYTQYQINRLKYDHAHDKDLFMIDGAVKKTVGGQLYYHVTSTKDKMINGYVYAGKGYLDNQVNSSFSGLSLVAR